MGQLWYRPGDGAACAERVGGATKTAVAAKVAKLEAERDGGYAGLAGRTTVTQWLDYWIASKAGNVRAKTIRR